MTQNQDIFHSAFGPHYMLDGYGGCKIDLEKLNNVYTFLNGLPKIIQMTPVMPPYAFVYKGKNPEDWGLSGFVIIAESHISIHTFPDKEFLSVDVFSCKWFDHTLISTYVTNLFGIARYEEKLLDRGLEFPRNKELVTNHILHDRRFVNC